MASRSSTKTKAPTPEIAPETMIAQFKGRLTRGSEILFGIDIGDAVKPPQYDLWLDEFERIDKAYRAAVDANDGKG